MNVINPIVANKRNVLNNNKHMICNIPKQALFAGLLTLLIFNSCNKSDEDGLVVKPNIEFYGLNNANGLSRYNANNSTVPMSTVAISGLQTGETLMAMDFRPATGQLYGLGSSSRLYVINQETGMAIALGTAPFTPALAGTLAGFDFNPTVDRIRVVTSSGQNLRLNPETGTVAATDGVINPGSPAITAVAYTNSVAGAASTTLFDIDIVAGKLFKQDPPNNGTLVEVGLMGFTGSGDAGFDISPDNSIALACFNIGGSTVLHQIDLNTGKATNLGTTPSPVISIAIPSNPVAYAVDSSNNLLIFNFKNPATPASKPITGLQIGEKVMGIDMRPATGQLYALGSSSRLYALNMSSGVATAIGTSPFLTTLSGTSFGFDFNPTVDRIRVVSNTGQNLRLNPIDGTVAAVDLAINPSTVNVSGAAYTNNFQGATTTVLFDIDPSSDKLYRQIPPNDGVLVEVGNLGVNIISENGFDIGGTSNVGYGVFTTGGLTRIYSINITSGAVTLISDFPNSIVGFALGLGY